MRKMVTYCVAAILGASIFLAGCGGGGTQDSTKTAKTESTGRIGMILGVGGLGDQSFNDLAYAGLEKAKGELGIEYDYVEPKQASDFELFLREMAAEESYDAIISIGFDQVDALTKVSAEFPDQKFGFIDGVVEAPNVVSYVSAEEQGSFLVGALAGLMKKESAAYGLNDKNVLGFVGALDIPLINKFYAGFEAGARYVNPDLSVRGDYTGSFDDVTIAKEISNTMNGAGVDIIYHGAGGAGLGVFQSAQEKNYFAIGANSNQNPSYPDQIIASMLKRVDTAVFEITKAACIDKNMTGGNVVELGLPDDGVGYTLEGSNIKVSDEIIKEVETIRQQVIDGKIVVPVEKGQIDEFLNNNPYTSVTP